MRLPFFLAMLCAALAGALPGHALAHPHGTMQCALSVAYENGQPTTLLARLTLDAPHSEQMLAMVRNTATGQLDAALQQRLLFGLKTQLARHDWLLRAQRQEQTAELTQRDEPKLVIAPDGRLAVDLALNIAVAQAKSAPDDATGQVWHYSCADPSLYWVSEFEPVQTPVATSGCLRPQVSVSPRVLTGAAAGSARAEVRCEP